MENLRKEEFAKKIENVRSKLYKTAMLYLGNETMAMDVLDETIYKAFCGYRRLREEQYFDTWITRILINECHNEQRRQKRYQDLEEIPETAEEVYDSLPLKEAVKRLPEDLKTIIILRYFAGFSLVETAEMLNIPQGTAATRQRKALKLLKLELE